MRIEIRKKEKLGAHVISLLARNDIPFSCISYGNKTLIVFSDVTPSKFEYEMEKHFGVLKVRHKGFTVYYSDSVYYDNKWLTAEEKYLLFQRFMPWAIVEMAKRGIKREKKILRAIRKI